MRRACAVLVIAVAGVEGDFRDDLADRAQQAAQQAAEQAKVLAMQQMLSRGVDADGDGQITLAEAQEALQRVIQMSGIDSTMAGLSEFAQQMGMQMDSDGNGVVTVDELQAGFASLDTNGDGMVSKSELFDLLTLNQMEGAPDGCPDGWTPSPSHLEAKCYKLLPNRHDRASYFPCAARCASESKAAAGVAALTCIESAEEDDFVRSVFATDPSCCGIGDSSDPSDDDFSCCTFIGLYQDANADTVSPTSGWHSWRSGCTSTYRNWAPGEPDEASGYVNGENCVVYGAMGGEGLGGADGWLDFPCEAPGDCLCEAAYIGDEPRPEAAEYGLSEGTPATGGDSGGVSVGVFVTVVVLALIAIGATVGGALIYVRRQAAMPPRSAQVTAGPSAFGGGAVPSPLTGPLPEMQLVTSTGAGAQGYQPPPRQMQQPLMAVTVSSDTAAV